MRQVFLPAAALALAVAATAQAAPVGDVFVLDFENNNATIGAGNGSTYSPIYGAAAAATYAPYINSLLSTNNGANGNPGAVNPAWGQVSYANQYHNAGDTNNTILTGNPGANDPNIHPSEPNYLWQESGSNLSISNDNDPYGSGGSVATIASYLATNPTNINGTSTVGQNLSGLLQAKGISWKSYQEGTGLLNSAGLPFNQNGGTLTNNVAPAAQATVPLVSFSGTSASYTNPYNGSHQYNFAAKHDGQLFFTDTRAFFIRL